MKQIINKYSNGRIYYKYYLNHSNQFNGLYISYFTDGIVYWKRNYLNGKRFGLDNWYGANNAKPIIITYHL